MLRMSVALVAVLTLSACGGGSRYSNSGAPAVKFASGPIQQACQRQGRKAASRARCGCVQAVANQELSPADQRRGAKYFKNPARLQEVRQSDNQSNERFWRAWKTFGQTAAAVCSGT
jgi:hypothetical protein